MNNQENKKGQLTPEEAKAKLQWGGVKVTTGDQTVLNQLKVLANIIAGADKDPKVPKIKAWVNSSPALTVGLLIGIAAVVAFAYSKIYPQNPCDLYPDLQCGKYANDNNNGGGGAVAGYRTCILNLVGGGLPECSDGTHGGDGIPKKTLVNKKLYDECRYVTAGGECVP